MTHDSGLRAVVQDLLIKHASELVNNNCSVHEYHEGREEWFKLLSQDVDFVLSIWEKTVNSSM